jgi:hypothetical protein
VLPGTYNVALVVDSRTIETRALRVNADPEVVLTDADRRKLFDMAMELHELQRRTTEVANQVTPLNTRLGELSKEVGSRTDLPADLKTMFDGISKELTAFAPKVAPPAGGRGFGGGGGRGGAGADNPVARLAQAKNALMGGMWPTASTMQAYTDSKAQVPKLIAEANALFTKATALSGALARHNLTLAAPTVVK